MTHGVQRRKRAHTCSGMRREGKSRDRQRRRRAAAHQVEQEQAPQARRDGQGHQHPPGEGGVGCGVPQAGRRGGLLAQAVGCRRLHLDHAHPSAAALQIARAGPQRAVRVQPRLAGVPGGHGGRCCPAKLLLHATMGRCAPSCAAATAAVFKCFGRLGRCKGLQAAASCGGDGQAALEMLADSQAARVSTAAVPSSGMGAGGCAVL